MLKSLAALAARLEKQPLFPDAPDAGGFLEPASGAEDGTLTGEEAARLPGGVVEAYRSLRRARYVGKRMRLVRFAPEALPDVLTRAPGDVTPPFTLRPFSDVTIAAQGFRAPGDEPAHAWQGVAAVVEPAAPVRERHGLTLTWFDRHLLLALDGPLPLRMVPLGDGLHAIYEVEPAGLPDDHAGPTPGLEGPGPSATPAPKYTPGTVDIDAPACHDGDGNPVITVAVGFTVEAADAYAAFGPAIERALLKLVAVHLVTRANFAFAVSGAKVALRLARAQRIPAASERALDRGAGWTAVMLDLAFAGVIEQLNLHCWWGESGASVMVLVGRFGGPPVDPTKDTGFAGVTRKPSGVWTPPALARIYDEARQGFAVGTVAYAVAKLDAALNHHTFTHEIAHMLGADHEAEQRGTPLRILDNGRLHDSARGHVMQSRPRSVTLMCVGERSSDRRHRAGMLSTTTPGPLPPLPMPPATAGSADEDNVRIVNRLAPFLSRHRPPACR